MGKAQAGGMRRTALTALLAVCLAQSAGATPAEDAASWLVKHQLADGSWAVEGGDDYGAFVSASVLQGLMDYSNATGDAKVKEAIKAGKRWLSGRTPPYTMALSASQAVMGDASLARDIVEMQNQDGGWGRSVGFESTPLYSARAALALIPYPEHRESVRLAREYLVKAQEVAGSWENSALSTASAVLALANLYALEPRDRYIASAGEGAQWLMESQRRTGSWIDVPSAAEALLALRAMHALLDDDAYAKPIENAERWLLEHANGDGSFGGYMAHAPGPGDAQATARVLSALTSKSGLPAAKPVLIANLEAQPGEFMAGDTIAFSARISNGGPFAVKDLALRLEPSWSLDGALSLGLGNLSSGSSVARGSAVTVPMGVVGEHIVRLSGSYSRGDGKGVFSLPEKVAEIKVLPMPLAVELDPKVARERTKESFRLRLINLGDGELRIKNLSWSIDGSWAANGSSDADGLLVPVGSAVEVGLFEGAPPAKGNYMANLSVRALHPRLGYRVYAFAEEISVVGGGVEALLYAAKLPSAIYNLIVLATMAAALILVLNLLLGIDLAR